MATTTNITVNNGTEAIRTLRYNGVVYRIPDNIVEDDDVKGLIHQMDDSADVSGDLTWNITSRSPLTLEAVLTPVAQNKGMGC